MLAKASSIYIYRVIQETAQKETHGAVFGNWDIFDQKKKLCQNIFLIFL